ncbi:septal ring lytic transglycosylase RlpA family protein [Acinetobacter populi]|jgi:rare lipoprotein A|uniref:Endolytic peptidoglycan transglycosylase RlpA n=1 Tax=Acinetobacter populi TaxID=1582270 RepID=A0A1Z9Z1E8_9GAMM|nr:septal ring lytic transglycosylase RlpA family protein [Acinetobacter populi]MCH4246242.1 septal ring lytic transglycosylase RlpA family protein [Acinetobacter populi]OUY08242.1 septal ring lytic transglycosylase RlpA family lipoprotein [Acinetobacter populi]
MQKSFKHLLFIVTSTVALTAQADMLPTQNLHNNSDNTSLSSRVIDKDIQALSDSLFKGNGNALTGLSITETSNNRIVNKETVAAKVHVPDDEPGLLDRLNTVASNTVKKFSQSGLASWYGRQFHGRPTASGERFDMNALTAAHRSLPLNCYIRVTNKSNGKSVVVKVNDRGPFHGNRVLDLSYGAAQAIGLAGSGVGNVTIERVDGPNS